MPLKSCQQKIIIKMLCDGHKTTFFDQDIYKTYQLFKNEMQLLRNADLVSVRTIKKDGKFVIEYSLSMDGMIFGKALKMVSDKLIA